MTQHIKIAAWAADNATFGKVMVQLGLATQGKDGVVFHDLQIAGGGHCGWSGKIPDKSSPLRKDKDGNNLAGSYTDDLPGVFYNMNALERKKHDGSKSLAEMLRRHPVTEEEYEQTHEVDGKTVRKHLLDRTCLEYGVVANGGRRTATVGTKGDPKAPPRVEVLDKAGDVIFWLGCPSDISDLFNRWG